MRADFVMGGSFEAPPAAPALTPPWTGGGALGAAVSNLGGIWNATHGEQFAILTTWQSNLDDSSQPIVPPFGGALGTLVVGGAAPVEAIEAFRGYAPPGPLVMPTASQGSAIKTTFNVGSNQRLELEFLFPTNEDFRGGLPDFAFMAIDGGPPILLSSVPGLFGPLPLHGHFGSQSSTDWSTASMLLSPGIRTLLLGVTDFGDTQFSSASVVENVRQPAIPESAFAAHSDSFATVVLLFIRRCRTQSPHSCCN